VTSPGRLRPRWGRRLAVAGAVCAALLAGGVGTAWAHPLHTAWAELTASGDGQLRVLVRAFADDFSIAAARAARRAPPPDHSVTDSVAAAYVGQALQLTVDGRPVLLQLVGQVHDGDVTRLEFRASGVATLRGAVVTNRLLLELHADQVNVVQARYDGRAFTTMFSRGSERRDLP
jgi:Domain of unknown function (DUF6702)